MSAFARRAAALAVLILAAACAERPSPLEPIRAPAESGRLAAPVVGVVSPQEARNERLARRLAIALGNDAFRAQVYQSLRQSTEREGKVYLQRFLSAASGAAGHELARLSAELESSVSADLLPSPPLEFYLPVPGHRSRWQGQRNLMVATAERDGDVPVAFDTWGRRHLLNPGTPPTIPVIALGRAESSFGEHGLALDVCSGCFTDPGAGGSGAAPPTGGGLYMTYARFDDLFEGWLKGDPEFEVHIMGQDGSSSAMKSYQCAGEKAGAPYQFDQNQQEWRGSVMLFSQAQLDAYKAQHPNQGLRVFVVEDDDGACVIKTDSARVDRLFTQLVQTYGDLTGGKDSALVSIKTFKKAFSLLKLFKSTWSVITTADDVVGTAIEDVVAHESYPGANWIVKGDNTITHGALRLEMR